MTNIWFDFQVKEKMIEHHYLPGYPILPPDIVGKIAEFTDEETFINLTQIFSLSTMNFTNARDYNFLLCLGSQLKPWISTYYNNYPEASKLIEEQFVWGMSILENTGDRKIHEHILINILQIVEHNVLEWSEIWIRGLLCGNYKRCRTGKFIKLYVDYKLIDDFLLVVNGMGIRALLCAIPNILMYINWTQRYSDIVILLTRWKARFPEIGIPETHPVIFRLIQLINKVRDKSLTISEAKTLGKYSRLARELLVAK